MLNSSRIDYPILFNRNSAHVSNRVGTLRTRMHACATSRGPAPSPLGLYELHDVAHFLVRYRFLGTSTLNSP
jgi:hypothetical protein